MLTKAIPPVQTLVHLADSAETDAWLDLGLTRWKLAIQWAQPSGLHHLPR